MLRDEPPDEAAARLRAMEEQDWRELMAAAEAMGVAPLLPGRAEKAQISIPAAIRAELRESLQGHTGRNLLLLAEFSKVAGALQRAGIAFLVFKGVHLFTSLYENIGERPTWDMDVLVRLEDIPGALASVKAAGYRPSRPFDLDKEVRHYQHLPAFVKPGAPPLEIHWTLLNPRFPNGLNWQELWERSVVSRIGDAEARVFSSEDLLVYLCAHTAYQHIYINSTRSLYDIKLLVRHHGDQLDWGAMTARAKTWGLASAVYLTLRLTDDLLGCPLPESTWQVLRPADFSERLVEAALTRLLEHSGSSPVVSAVWSRQSLLERVRGLWGRLAVPRSILAGRYRLAPTSWKVSFYYLVRARDLLRVHGRDLLGLMLGRRRRRDAALRESELIAYLGWWQ